ncbi:MAG TPA: hypothetical protein VH540_06105 [Ktedonobacterales bacterium]
MFTTTTERPSGETATPSSERPTGTVAPSVGWVGSAALSNMVRLALLVGPERRQPSGESARSTDCSLAFPSKTGLRRM